MSDHESNEAITAGALAWVLAAILFLAVVIGTIIGNIGDAVGWW